MTKAELRTLYKAKRKSLSAEAIALASEQIVRQFQAYMASISVTCCHIFLPIQSQNEVDTWPIIHWLWQNHPAITVVTSISDFDTHTLSHVILTPESKLIMNRYGIPEPALLTSHTLSASAIDLVLVPLLIFDRQGHRVGYGKGFYDRFLADCRPDCLKIGLSLFEPVERIDNTNDQDIALTVCIIPEQVWNFS